jgi:hypothetical protein
MTLLEQRMETVSENAFYRRSAGRWWSIGRAGAVAVSE